MGRPHIISLGVSSVIVLLSFVLAGCDTVPPPIVPEPTPDPVVIEEPAQPIAASVDMGMLRPMAERQRERLRGLIDLAERREINENGPRMLRAAKETSRTLDRIEARIDDAMRMGSGSGDADEIHEELRRLSTRLDLLADTLR